MPRPFRLLAVLCLLASPAGAQDPDPAPLAPVLPPHAEPALRAALGVGSDAAPLADGVALDANIDRDRVLVTGRRDGATVLVVTLRHPDALASTPGARRAGPDLVLVPQPGPAPAPLVDALVARLAAPRAEIPWIHPEPPRPPPPAAAPGPDLGAELRRIRHRIAIGEVEGARAALTALERKATGRWRLDLARVRARLGDTDRARALAADFVDAPGVDGALAAIVSGRPVEVPAGDCAWVSVVDALRELGRTGEALAAARRVGTSACPEGATMLVGALIDAGRRDDAAQVAEAAVATYPEHQGVLSMAAAAHHAVGDFARAAARAETAARLGDPRGARLTALLGSLVRDVDGRDGHITRLTAALEAEPEDRVSRFLLGVLHHYDDRFERSDELLAPLEAIYPDQQRLQIYLAMNAFNTGRAPEAVRRLERAAEAADPDPDVYYCLAEVLRDTDRRRARQNLARYIAMSEGNPLSNPAKQVRVAGMLAALDGCLATGVAVCPGDWEHPRGRDHRGGRDDEVPWLPWLGLAGVLAALGVFAARRRRRDPAAEP